MESQAATPARFSRPLRRLSEPLQNGANVARTSGGFCPGGHGLEEAEDCTDSGRSELQRLKQLEDEHGHLKHVVAEQTLDDGQAGVEGRDRLSGGTGDLWAGPVKPRAESVGSRPRREERDKTGRQTKVRRARFT